MIIAQVPLLYDRTGIIRIENDKCNLCNEENKICLLIDGSDEEYGEISICKDCINKAFIKFKGQ